MEMRLGYMGVNRFMANNSPTFDYQYQDKYTEIHFWIKELLSLGAIKIRWNQNLIDQCRVRKYVVMSKDSKLKTQPKEQHRADNGGKSPDELDTLIYTFADLQMDAIRRGLMAASEVKSKVIDTPSRMEIEAARRSVGGGAFAGMRHVPRWTPPVVGRKS